MLIKNFYKNGLFANKILKFTSDSEMRAEKTFLHHRTQTQSLERMSEKVSNL